MTEREKIERELIFDILAESSKWRITEEDQNEDCIRLEVMDRARRLLLDVETVDANGYAQSHPDNLQGELEVSKELDKMLASPDKVTNAKERGKHVRVMFNDGRQHLAKREHCTKVKCGDRWKWELLPEFENEYNFSGQQD